LYRKGNNTGTEGSVAVQNWSAGVYHWFKRIITGRKSMRLGEMMKINGNGDTAIVGMQHTKARIGEFLKEIRKVM
jgi:hypothetical protein